MTGKRFHYHVDEVGVYYYVCDNTKKGDDKIIFEFDTKFDAMEVCELLNALNDENEQLKTELINIEVDRDYFKAKAGSLEEGYLQLQDREIRLKRENEQLRTALKELREIGDYQADRIQELSDDNEELKEEIKDYNDVLARLEEKQQRERTATQKQHQKWSKEAEEQIQALQKQLESEHQMLENAILLERTRMGQNALKQFRDAIQ